MNSLNHNVAPETPVSCPYPLGASMTPDGTNFSIFSASAWGMHLVLFDPSDPPHDDAIALRYHFSIRM
jgi:pullulanase/glycogen debranching enzyme